MRVHESIISLYQTPTQRFFPFRVLIVRVLVHSRTVYRPKTAEAFNYSLWETKPTLEGEITLTSGRYVQNHCERAIVQRSYCGLVVSKVFFVPSSPAVSCVWRSGRRMEEEKDRERKAQTTQTECHQCPDLLQVIYCTLLCKCECGKILNGSFKIPFPIEK